MSEDFIPRLRGNTFFLFLLRAARDDLGVAPSFGSSSQGLTQTQMFANLMRTVHSTYTVNNEDSLRQNISKYMKGKLTNSPTYYPFKNVGFQQNAALRMENEYSDALSEMDHLCRTFLDYENDGRMKMLVGGLIELIASDPSVLPSAAFRTGYKEVTKAALAQETDFILSPFLLSVWYYIVEEQPNAEEGADTYMRWTRDAGGGNPREITTDIGTERAKKIAVSIDLPEEDQTDTAEEVAEEEAVVMELAKEEEKEIKQQTLVSHNGRIYNQNAEKIVNIEHVETLYI